MTGLLEREELLADLAAARANGGRLIFIGGEAGVGKTALLRAFAAASNGTVLQGACDSLTTPTPLAPFLDISTQTGGELRARVVAGDHPRHVAAALLDELGSPTVVVLEDVHWADQATLDVLRVVGRRIASTGGLVLATFRDDEVDAGHPLRIVLGELVSAPAVSRMSVPRLTLNAVRELAAPHGVDADALHRLTQGNAFYVTEVLAAGDVALPETVRDAVVARAAKLSPAARRVLDAAAAVPTRAELWLLERVAPKEHLALDECLSSGILRSDRDAVAFRHELARLAWESTLSPQRRRALQARILEALSSPPVGEPDPSRLAHHAEEAGDTAAVLLHAPAAARRAAASSAHREAASQLARALRHAEGRPVSERAELVAAYALETQLIGRYEDSIVARLQAVDLYRELGDPLREGDMLTRLTAPYISQGRTAEAEEASRAAIELLERLPPGVQLANAYATQALTRMLARDNDDGVVWGELSVVVARELGDDETLSFGLNMIGTSHVMAGRIETGIDHLLQSLDVARRAGLEFRESSALGMLGSGLGEMYELERSEVYLRQHIEFCEERELDPNYSRAWLALVLVYTGRWDEGAALAREVVASGAGIARISALIALGRLRARRGDPGGREPLDEALELAQVGGHLQRLGHIHAARAEEAWLAGDPQRAAEEARAAYPLALEKQHLWFAGELAYWQWRAGELDDAPGWIADPYRRQFDGDAAGAWEAWTARGCSYEAARALADAGDEESLRTALGVFEQLGARLAAEACRRSLRALGVRGPRPATRANPGGLTTRELEVLDLLGEGLTNLEIAGRLVISEKTVGHHVSAILGKLGVRSRYDAAKFAVQDKELAGR